MFAIQLAVFLVVYVALPFILPNPLESPAMVETSLRRLSPAVTLESFQPTLCVRAPTTPTMVTVSSNSNSPLPFVIASFVVALVAVLMVTQRRGQLAEAVEVEPALVSIPPFSLAISPSSSISPSISPSRPFSHYVLASPFKTQCATGFSNVKLVVASDPTGSFFRNLKLIAFACFALGVSQIPRVCVWLWDIPSKDMVAVSGVARTVRFLGRVVCDVDEIVVDAIVNVASLSPRDRWTVFDRIISTFNGIGTSLSARCESVERALVSSIAMFYADLSAHPIFPAFWSLLSSEEVVVFVGVGLAACWLSAGGISLGRCWYDTRNKTGIIMAWLSVQVRLAQSHLKCSILVYVACVGSLVVVTRRACEREVATPFCQLTLSPSLQCVIDLLPLSRCPDSFTGGEDGISGCESLLKDEDSFDGVAFPLHFSSQPSRPSPSSPSSWLFSPADSRQPVADDDFFASMSSPWDQPEPLSTADSLKLPEDSDDVLLPPSPSFTPSSSSSPWNLVPFFRTDEPSGPPSIQSSSFIPSSSSSPWNQCPFFRADDSCAPPPAIRQFCLFSASDSRSTIDNESIGDFFDSDDEGSSDAGFYASIFSSSNQSLLSDESLQSLSSLEDDDDSFNKLPPSSCLLRPLSSPSKRASASSESTTPLTQLDCDPSSQEAEDVGLAKTLSMRMDNWLASPTSLPPPLDSSPKVLRVPLRRRFMLAPRLDTIDEEDEPSPSTRPLSPTKTKTHVKSAFQQSRSDTKEALQRATRILLRKTTLISAAVKRVPRTEKPFDSSTTSSSGKRVLRRWPTVLDNSRWRF